MRSKNLLGRVQAFLAGVLSPGRGPTQTFTPDGIRRVYAAGPSRRPPHSKSISGNFYRWQSQEHLGHGDQFWKTFLNGQFKWASCDRYAGRGYNCGHYFAFTPEGARAESAFYNRDYEKNRVLLEVAASLDNILDLTDEESIRYVFAEREFIDVGWARSGHFPPLLKFLIDSQAGGNEITDEIGCWAWESGYSGISFYSTRALTDDFREWVSRSSPWDYLDGSYEIIYEIAQDKSLHNLVVFNGAELTSRISAYRVGAGDWRPNPYHGFTPERIDAVLNANGNDGDSNYQVEMSREGLFIPGRKEVTLGKRS